MDHLNNKLSEISSRIDHLERLTLQIQRDNHLKHEELKQYISATFNLIHSSINASSAPNTSAEKISSVVVPGGVGVVGGPYSQETHHHHQQQQQQQQNGSNTSSFDLLVPPSNSPFLSSAANSVNDPTSNSNSDTHNQQQHTQSQIVSSQYANQQLPILRNPIYNQHLQPTTSTVGLDQQQQQQQQQQGQLQNQMRVQQHDSLDHQDPNLQLQQLQQPQPQQLQVLKPQQQQQQQQQQLGGDVDNSQPHPDIPLVTIKRSLANVEDIWREYYYGLEGNPSIRSLDAQYGRLWRDKQKERTYFRRKKIFGFIERYMEYYDCNETQAIDYLENYRKDQNTGKKRTLMWLYTHMPSLPDEN